MDKPSDEDRRSRRAQQARDLRKVKGLKPRGGHREAAGRKLTDTDRPTCCGVLMGSWGDRRWRCRGECRKFKTKPNK